MKNTYAALLAVGTGIVGLGIGAIGAGVIGVGAVLGGSVAGTMNGICMATDASVETGLLNEQQLDQLATGIGNKITEQYPDIAKAIKEDNTSNNSDVITNQSGQNVSTNCDLVITRILTALKQN